ncbi:MAG: adenylate/guanylate cyclase domain-containing protein [Burkholderiales bacterium]|nr:adenylate/guanylate cyclase domain-containing protein [Burkholderiales bacterium]
MAPGLEDTRRADAGAPAGIVAVLFADVAGSTKLYEALGDAAAKAMIDETLIELRAVTSRHGGRVIKTIGDEVMCVFDGADRGFIAATDMQNRVDRLPAVGGAKRHIRVGFHAGPVIEENGDVFGDTVNIAARMAGLAKGMQIITTRATVDMLAPALRMGTRDIASLSVKGKADDLPVCEVIWQEGDDLTMTAPSVSLPRSQAVLVLVHGGRELVMNDARAAVALGRDGASDIIVADPKASRHHARIEKRRDKFFLADQSTNGTFVTFAGEAELSLRREELMLRGAGRIVFGHSASESLAESVEFSVRG